MKMDDRLKEFYKNYPDKFIEDILEMKLFVWQRILLRMIIK
jgi:hypothetical protein